MPKLKDLFDLSYGKSKFTRKDIEDNGIYPMITSKGTNNGIWGVTNKHFEYKNVISIPRTGTVCHAFYQSLPCLINSDCIVAEPKRKFSEEEMLYFSLLIRQEKYKFSYSRKVTPKRIGDIEIPLETPYWLHATLQLNFNDLNDIHTSKIIPLDTAKWRSFKLIDLFDIISGKGPSIVQAKKAPGNIPLITATEKNNGISNWTNYESSHPSNVITIAKNGSIGESFYQPKPFCASSDVAILIPRFKLNPYIAIFLISLIRKEKYRFNYGLKWNINRMKESIIRLPIDIYNRPDWKWVEEFIKSLKYSKLIAKR